MRQDRLVAHIRRCWSLCVGSPCCVCRPHPLPLCSTCEGSEGGGMPSWLQSRLMSVVANITLQASGCGCCLGFFTCAPHIHWLVCVRPCVHVNVWACVHAHVIVYGWRWVPTATCDVVFPCPCSAQISNLVFKYQHADVLCSVALESLFYSSAAPETWMPQFQQPSGSRKTINKVRPCVCGQRYPLPARPPPSAAPYCGPCM